MNLIEVIEKELRESTETRKKYATFLYLVLLHADELKKYDPVDFCNKVKVSNGYKIEFNKMIKVAELMKEKGMKIGKE